MLYITNGQKIEAEWWSTFLQSGHTLHMLSHTLHMLSEGVL